MAEEKEQLKIEAQFDTSKLKQQAKVGLNDVVNEEKKVENQSRQTSRAINEIGNSGKNVGSTLQQAGNQGTQALRQMGLEADKTAKKIAGINTSVKDIKLGQALHMASQFVNSSDTGKALGGYLGNAFGMSADDKGLAGAAISAGLAGAQTGAMVAGVPGAIVAGLTSAGVGLLTAAQEQEKAAVALIKAADERQVANRERTKEIDRQEAEAKKNKDFETKFNELISKGDYAAASALVAQSRKEYHSQFELGDKGIRNAAIQMDATPLANRGVAYKSYDDYLAMRTSAKTGLSNLDKYEARIKAAQEKEARDAERKVQEEQSRKQAEDAARNREKIKSAETLLGYVNKEGQTRLSDSLTRVGGGAGYGARMQSITSKVVDISKDIRRIVEILQNPTENFDMGVF